MTSAATDVSFPVRKNGHSCVDIHHDGGKSLSLVTLYSPCGNAVCLRQRQLRKHARWLLDVVAAGNDSSASSHTSPGPRGGHTGTSERVRRPGTYGSEQCISKLSRHHETLSGILWSIIEVSVTCEAVSVIHEGLKFLTVGLRRRRVKLVANVLPRAWQRLQ